VIGKPNQTTRNSTQLEKTATSSMPVLLSATHEDDEDPKGR
jgi:hypothetical protein